jgi:hypothetical protein
MLTVRNSTLKTDVIHDALKEIRNENLKRLRKFGDIGTFGDMGARTILAQNVKLRRFFCRYWKISRYLAGNMSPVYVYVLQKCVKFLNQQKPINFDFFHPIKCYKFF